MDVVEEARSKGIHLGDFVEVCLLKGVKFDMTASSYPCAYRPETPTELPGSKVGGYVLVLEKSSHSSWVDICPSRDTNLGLGGFRVYEGAIHSLGKASSDLAKRE
jgi:hypothetical protein